MRKIALLLLTIIAFGCAKVQVETTKPIKVDVNMRVDVYQHVVKDVESVNDQIYYTSFKKLFPSPDIKYQL